MHKKYGARSSSKQASVTWLQRRYLANQNKSSSRFDFINKPIFLWLLSSVALGAASYFYGNFSTCRAAQLVDEQLLHKDLAELTGRISAIENISSRLRKAGGALKQEKRLIDSHVNYIFLENKDRGEPEIKTSIIWIFKKWNEWPLDDRDDIIDNQQDISLFNFIREHSNSGKTDLEVKDYTERKFYIEYFLLEYEDSFDNIESSLDLSPNSSEEKTISSRIDDAAGAGEIISIMSDFTFLRLGYCYKRFKWPY